MVGSETHAKVAAVVVTYNRREKLPRCIESILGQSRSPDVVIVVDNASTDGTEVLLEELKQREPRMSVIRMRENTGGAGGFHEGLRAGVLGGADFLWVMDDDCYPRRTALERLLDAFPAYEKRWGEPPGFACSRVLADDESSVCEMNIPGVARNWNFPYSDDFRVIAVNWCSFASCLVRAEDVKAIGLPLKEYFIWYDDMEYTKRLALRRPGLAVMDSVAVHDMPASDPVDWQMITWENLWKYRFGLRNEASWRLYHESWKSYLHFLKIVWRQSGKGTASLGLRLALMAWGIKAISFNPQPDFVAD